MMSDLTDELLCLLGEGRKIEAVRRYREVTGVDLARAKQAVDDLEAGLQANAGASSVDDELSVAVLRLVREGDFIAAVKHYREATGRGLREAKEAVEAICRADGIDRPTVTPSPTGFFIALGIVASVIAAVVLALSLVK
jgi:ribosomal protein L7/L12